MFCYKSLALFNTYININRYSTKIVLGIVLLKHLRKT